MSADGSPSAHPAVTHLFDTFFDDAALFPPGDAPLEVAVPAHRRLRQERGRYTGPFVATTAHLDALTSWPDGGPPLCIAVLARPGDVADVVRRVTHASGLRLAGVELPTVEDRAGATRAVAALATLPEQVAGTVEVTTGPGLPAVLDALVGSGHRAKVRTGGLRAELVPSTARLALALRACAEREVPLKCTAGLHHAVRHVDPSTGITHHGFLNVLLAAGSAARGASTADVEAALTETTTGHLLAELGGWTTADAATARDLLASIGTCAVDDGVDDLVALGLLPTSTPPRRP